MVPETRGSYLSYGCRLSELHVYTAVFTQRRCGMMIMHPLDSQRGKWLASALPSLLKTARAKPLQDNNKQQGYQ